MSTQIGFIGQGWIGKHYADDFEKRGYDTVRYALEAPFNENRERIKACDVVFIAVPTPTTPEGFDASIIEETLSLVGKGKTAVIKSTVTIGTTARLQALYPDIVLLHSPEFLREASAAHDAAHPDRNIIGIAEDTKRHRDAAAFVLRVLPYAPYAVIVPSNEAEFVKYAGNCFLYVKVVFMNMLYDLAEGTGCEWDRVRDAMVADPRIGESHTRPFHSSGRGAGGHCFIKDFAAFREMYAALGNSKGINFLDAATELNAQLLLASNKDIDLLEGVYGKQYVEKHKGSDGLS